MESVIAIFLFVSKADWLVLFVLDSDGNFLSSSTQKVWQNLNLNLKQHTLTESALYKNIAASIIFQLAPWEPV